MGGKVDDICIILVSKVIFIDNFTFWSFYSVSGSRICLCKQLIDGLVVYLSLNNSLPWENGYHENMRLEYTQNTWNVTNTMN